MSRTGKDREEVPGGFHTSAGWKAIAEIAKWNIQQPWNNAKKIATSAGVPQSTFSNIGKNLMNGERVDGKRFIAHLIDDDTICKIEPYLLNPETGKPFETGALMAIASGGKVVPASVVPTVKKDGQLFRESEGLRQVKAAMGDRTLTQFAKCCKLPESDMAEILQGRDPNNVELIKIAACIDPQKNTQKLKEAYGYKDDPIELTVKSFRAGVSEHTDTKRQRQKTTER